MRWVVREGRLSGQYLPKYYSVGVDVGFEGVGLIFEDFWGHPVEGARHSCHGLTVLAGFTGQPEVSDLAVSIVKDCFDVPVQQNVQRLEIPVHQRLLE